MDGPNSGLSAEGMHADKHSTRPGEWTPAGGRLLAGFGGMLMGSLLKERLIGGL